VVEAALGYYRASHNPSLQDPSLKEDQDRISAGPITVPTLALHGTRDRPRRIDAFESEAMNRFFTGGLEKAIIPRTGHFMHQEKPQQVNPRIVEFLRR
jgi:pimeloyl-ACP methyl ester carboxylesterase